MSRIGRKPILIPPEVKLQLVDSTLIGRGPRGQLEKKLPAGLTVSIDQDRLAVGRLNGAKNQALQGLWRSLINNLIQGVNQGFERSLELKGVGYKATVEGEKLILWLGYSHPITYLIPQGVELKVEKNTLLKVAGCDKELVGQVAASIRRFRPVEPYQGRGIRYLGEPIRKKAGKAAKAAA